ncbi:cytochrome c [Conexibacter sp. SYSU D00693]|uniref:c-type cytochrome n=1 Tax=Conexibacter sp. SYSU D00693 TaxID=2812560 RepID=UPI00196A323E|nr:cytochrome c [Conexibacter sp. SYSU D00693]
MLQTIVFVLVFVLLGLSVVGVAMRSGRRRKPAGPTRAERRVTAIGVTVLTLVLGLAVPALVLVDNSESKAEDAPGGLELTKAQAEGRQDFKIRCAQCHTLGASNAVGKVGPNLDQMRPPKALILDAIEKGRARGQGQMPGGLVSGEDAEAVASYVAAVAGRTN